MLLDSKLLKFVWGYAILHANYMKNRTHTCTLPNKTPFEMVNHKKPNLYASHQRGSKVYVKIKQGDKLSSRATRAHWIGFSSQSNGHCIYWPESHKVTVEQNILFDKEKLHRYSPILPTNEEIQRPIDKEGKAQVQYQNTPHNYGPYAPPDDISKE